MSPLFRRRRQEDPEAAEQSEALDATGEPDAVDDVEADGPVPAHALYDRSAGPWDVSEKESTEGYVDLGALLVPAREAMELRLEIDEQAGHVTSATVQIEGSAVQLQVFAAPRSEGIWDEIRAEIAAGITRQGGTADEVPGTFGRELIARIPVRTADGRSGHQPARFVGVDGPRWFLRAVFHGVAVHEPENAGPVESVVRDAVVVRGAEAMAPRELLALTLPDQDGGEGEEEPDGDERPSLDPFTRGPEITEIR